MHHNPKSTSLSQFSESSHARSSGSRSVQQVPSSLGTRPRQEGASISPVPSDKDVWETVDEGELKDLVEQYGKSGGRFFSLDYVGWSTRSWIPLKSGENCSDKSCQKPLGRIGWPNHCWRCKEAFCKKCTRFRRRLNQLGHPDPSGRLYRVCAACYDEGPQTIGQSMSHTEYFKCMRRDASSSSSRLVKDKGAAMKGTPTNCSNYRERLDYDEECQRLKDGFKRSVGNSELWRTLVDFRSLVSKPEWQKSTYSAYGNLSSSCSICNTSFVGALTKLSKICCICGSRVCRGCSSKDLLVYIPDEEKGIKNPEPRLSVIKVVGCPEREPDLSLYLRVCNLCCHVLCEKQITSYQRDCSSSKDNPGNIQESSDFWKSITEANEEFQKIQDKVERHLTNYQELADVLEIQKGAAQHVSSDKPSNMQVLAKAQGDLSDHFTKLLMLLLSLKKLKPVTAAQSNILKNISKSVFEFHQENKFIFNELQHRLEVTTPREVLEYIQDIVDKNVLNTSYVTLKQIALEVLHYTTMQELDDSLLKKLLSAEGVVEKDLQLCVTKGKEDWNEHSEVISQLLKVQLRDHRIIKTSRTLTHNYGQNYVEMKMFERCEHVIREITMQLDSKCAERSFPKTKNVLKTLLHDVEALFEVRRQLMLSEREAGEWVVVNQS